MAAKLGEILVIGGHGYIGTSLCASLSRAGRRDVVTCDLSWFCGPDGNVGAARSNVLNRNTDYRGLESAYVRRFDAVVLLAGHSSVPMSLRSGAPATMRNNVRNFVELAGKLRSGQRLLYASSASVYNGLDGTCAEDGPLGRPANCYDRSKAAIDIVAPGATSPGVACYGLRFGTVNGGGPHIRVDLMLNQMYHSARQAGEVFASNPDVWRPILSLDDLCRAALYLLSTDAAAPGVYNLCSFNAQVRPMAEAVARHAGVPVRWGEPTPSYDMRISPEKLAQAGFRAQDGIDEILRSLDEGYDGARRTARTEGVPYE